jgi:signal transduction histidine kinase
MSPDARPEQSIRRVAGSGWSPAASDLALICGLLTYGLIEAVALGSGEPNPAGRLLAAAAMVAPLLWRRQYPLLVLPAVIAVIVAGTLADFVATDSILPLPAFVLAFFGLALSETPDDVPAYIGVSFIAAASFTLGRVFHRRTSESVRLARLSEQLEREQGARAREAVEQERARIGRELHDIVAHSISLIAVQSGAAAAMLRRDPDRAAASMDFVEGAAREALAEMRRLLGMLREGEPGGELAPQPGLGDVQQLVERARESGQAVQLRVEGAHRRVPLGVDLAGFRIVQEALTNARRHSNGGTTDVRIACRPSGLEIRVTNPIPEQAPPPDPAGHGLVGMRERTLLYGGHFEAGPQSDGTYRVAARLPTGHDA